MTLCLKLLWFCHIKVGQLLYNCLIIALVPGLFFGRKLTEICCHFAVALSMTKWLKFKQLLCSVCFSIGCKSFGKTPFIASEMLHNNFERNEFLMSKNWSSSLVLQSYSGHCQYNWWYPQNAYLVGSMEAPSKAFLLIFMLPDWLKFNYLKSRMECVFSGELGPGSKPSSFAYV